MRLPEPTLAADSREIDEDFRALCISAVQMVKDQTNDLIDAAWRQDQTEQEDPANAAKVWAESKAENDPQTEGRRQLYEFITKSATRPKLYKWKVMGATSAYGVLVGFMIVGSKSALAYMVWVDLKDEDQWQIKASTSRRLK